MQGWGWVRDHGLSRASDWSLRPRVRHEHQKVQAGWLWRIAEEIQNCSTSTWSVHVNHTNAANKQTKHLGSQSCTWVVLLRHIRYCRHHIKLMAIIPATLRALCSKAPWHEVVCRHLSTAWVTRHLPLPHGFRIFLSQLMEQYKSLQSPMVAVTSLAFSLFSFNWIQRKITDAKITCWPGQSGKLSVHLLMAL